MSETSSPIDKARLVAYLDTAAIDDWEGLWLLMGSEGSCYVVMERINDYAHQSLYTHRIRLWSGTYGASRPEVGTVLGYLEHGVYDNVKRITLFDGYLMPHRNYTSTVRMDDDCRYIIFGATHISGSRKSEYNRMGMKRIYPQRSSEEREYKVRYL